MRPLQTYRKAFHTYFFIPDQELNFESKINHNRILIEYAYGYRIKK
jgi:hypothetical protein